MGNPSNTEHRLDNDVRAMDDEANVKSAYDCTFSPSIHIYVLNEKFDILGANLASRVGPDPADLMHALSRVDEERPPAQVGEAARRAARELQRAGEAGFAGSVGGEKKLTTPREMTPGTPRRGNTPGR